MFKYTDRAQEKQITCNRVKRFGLQKGGKTKKTVSVIDYILLILLLRANLFILCHIDKVTPEGNGALTHWPDHRLKKTKINK